MGHLKTPLLQILGNLLTGEIHQVNRQNRAVKVDVKDSIFVDIRELLHICFQCRIRLVIWNENQLLDRVEHSIVLIDLHTDASLMPSAVHIAIHHKPHILCLIHIQDLDIMVIIIAPNIVPIIKAEKIRHLLVRRMITKQLVFIDKGKV